MRLTDLPTSEDRPARLGCLSALVPTATGRGDAVLWLNAGAVYLDHAQASELRDHLNAALGDNVATEPAVLTPFEQLLADRLADRLAESMLDAAKESSL